MEFWVSKADYSRFYFLNRAIQIKTDVIPPNACLQYSITPVFHHSTAYEYGSANLLLPGLKDQVFSIRIKNMNYNFVIFLLNFHQICKIAILIFPPSDHSTY